MRDNRDSEIRDPEEIGKKIIELYHHWNPADSKVSDQKIGTLYGFDCYIRQQQETMQEKGGFVYRYQNGFYARHSEGSIKYTYNNGHPSTENLKLAARYFLNAIDRVGKLKERYGRELEETQSQVAVLQKIIVAPFDKDDELKTLKLELKALEEKIKMKLSPSPAKENVTPVIKMNTVEEGNGVLQRGGGEG